MRLFQCRASQAATNNHRAQNDPSFKSGGAVEGSGLPPRGVRPVRGQIALLDTRMPLLRRVVFSEKGYVVPRAENPAVLAASWLSSKWPNRAPEGKVLMRTFIGGARDPRVLDQRDAELVKLSLDAVTPILGITAAPLFSRIYRWNRANAQHDVGHLARMQSIERALTKHPGLFLTGSGFRGVGVPDCIADGRATGKAVAEFLSTAKSMANG